MDEHRPLFVTSIARAGGTLLCQMLGAHRRIEVAADPYLPLMKLIRHALVAAAHVPCFEPDSPFDDYYFDADRLALLDVIQAGDLSLRRDPAAWPLPLNEIRGRAAAMSPDLIPHLDELTGPTWRSVVVNALGIVARARRARDGGWVGIKEVWTIELFAALARAFPYARFLVLMRDPRAVVSSMLKLGRVDPTQSGQALSYARHWRKYVAFCHHYATLPLLRSRLLVLRYEDLVGEPEQAAGRLCAFLEVDDDPAMVDPGSFVDHHTGGRWRGNSSFEGSLPTISDRPVDRWRQDPLTDPVRLVEYVCSPDLELAGYEPGAEDPAAGPDPTLLRYFIDHARPPAGWRTDFGDPQLDVGFETFRRSLLALDPRPSDRELIRRSFLFESVYDALRAPLRQPVLSGARDQW